MGAELNVNPIDFPPQSISRQGFFVCAVLYWETIIHLAPSCRPVGSRTFTFVAAGGRRPRMEAANSKLPQVLLQKQVKPRGPVDRANWGNRVSYLPSAGDECGQKGAIRCDNAVEMFISTLFCC